MAGSFMMPPPSITLIPPVFFITSLTDGITGETIDVPTLRNDMGTNIYYIAFFFYLVRRRVLGNLLVYWMLFCHWVLVRGRGLGIMYSGGNRKRCQGSLCVAFMLENISHWRKVLRWTFRERERENHLIMSKHCKISPSCHFLYRL